MCVLCGDPLLMHGLEDPIVKLADAGQAHAGPVSGFANVPSILETSDAAGNATTSYVLDVGQTAQGLLSSAADHDWYRVDLLAGETYTFAMTGTGTNNVVDTYLQLYDADGTTVLAQDDDSLSGANSILTYTALSTGTYYIDAGSFDDSHSGQYGVSVTLGTKASFDLLMGAGVIDSDLSWSSAPGVAILPTDLGADLSGSSVVPGRTSIAISIERGRRE